VPPGDRLINYYDILGVAEEADISEIKAAFRKLAKQYHPDRNPNGKEFFERALMAYETLSDPSLKTAYDHKLKSLHAQVPPREKRAPGKNWKFDEREMKRRQYYNEHIRKYARETASYNARNEGKRSYNEYKYILFATPLAVLLFVMIMKLTGPMVPKKQRSAAGGGAVLSERPSGLKPGDAPYNFIFGNPRYDLSGNRTLVIKNLTGMDVIVCIFSGREFIRSFFIQGGYSAEVPQLPARPLEIRYSSGLRFDYQTLLSEANVQGGFRQDRSYYRSLSSFLAGNGAELNLMPGINEGFLQTNEKEFFTLPQ
jgi:curved DNA-binding protein CbpA